MSSRQARIRSNTACIKKYGADLDKTDAERTKQMIRPIVGADTRG